MVEQCLQTVSVSPLMVSLLPDFSPATATHTLMAINRALATINHVWQQLTMFPATDTQAVFPLPWMVRLITVPFFVRPASLMYSGYFSI